MQESVDRSLSILLMLQITTKVISFIVIYSYLDA
nr:MAG TPA: hypothetical protein [Caudoviricetes sp.]